MRVRVALTDEAIAQRAALPPVAKRLVRRTLREMEDDLSSLDTIPLQRPESLYRVRAGSYRIVFQPGPAPQEITVVRIGHRRSVYEGLERRASGE